MTAPEELPISDVRDHFADVLGRATYAGQITYITKRGQRVGAVVPVEVAEAAEAAEDAYLLRLAREAEEELDRRRLDQAAARRRRRARHPSPAGPRAEEREGRKAAWSSGAQQPADRVDHSR